jgi:hypothetical protein
VKADLGELPRRDYGFALTRFMDEYEWGTEGDRVWDLVHQLLHIWRDQPK